MNRTATAGILTAKGLSEKCFFEKLACNAAREKVKFVVFSPNQTDWSSEKVNGLEYDIAAREWKDIICPLPKLIYDRSFFTSRKQLLDYKQFIAAYEQNKRGRVLNRRLGSKWHVWNILIQQPSLHHALPPTTQIRSCQDVLDWIERYDQAFIKPSAGTHGIGTAYIRKVGDNHFFVSGRNLRNQAFTLAKLDPQALCGWLNKALRTRAYLLQPFLQLSGCGGHPFDIRVLMQKNEFGQWTMTGKAARSGAAGSMTSNLHGGGIAADASKFLLKQFSDHAANQIEEQIEHLAYSVPRIIEQHYGRMLELGIDFGVEPDGKVWLLEVNSKPGRSAFQLAGLQQAERNAFLYPIRYIRYLLEQSLGG